MELHNEEFDLRRSIEGALGTLAVLAREKGLRFDVEIAPELPERVRGDRGHLGQVLVNIVGNAIKFTENGAVSVKTSPAGPRREGNACVLVEVADTGAGIDPARLPKIFESFEQESASVHARYGGTGLGLTIAKRLVELMGGRIWAESRPGEGSTFRFTVELEQAEPGKTFAAAEKPAARLANGGCLRVLLAEDNPVNQLLGKALLEREGHTVVVAEDGRKAVEALARERFGIVLMDVRMPELNGDEIARMVREGLIPGCPRDIPIIALTAHALVGDRERFLAAGMDGYLAKPIDVEEFRRALLAAMEKGPGGSIR
ncbi:MAG: response regulator [Deltaproteobacteria bacterium]|nr:response regulator [Deltaproteobacteria bacterium]